MKKVDSEYFAHTDNNDTCIVFNKPLISIDTIRTRECYDLLIGKIFKQPSSQKTIARKLNVKTSNWKEIYTFSRKITHDSYSKIFQYKILNNILYLNKHLHQSKIVSTPLWSLCSSVNETVFHLFWECLLTIKLWKIVQKWSATVGLVLSDLDAKGSVLGLLTTEGILFWNIMYLFLKCFCIETSKIRMLYPFLISDNIWNRFMILNTLSLGVTGAWLDIIQNGTINTSLTINRIYQG